MNTCDYIINILISLWLTIDATLMIYIKQLHRVKLLYFRQEGDVILWPHIALA